MSHVATATPGRVFHRWPGPGGPPRLQPKADDFPATAPYDIAILGAGVVGCAIAYVLSQYQLRIVLLDRNHDVGEGTSKGNSAIIHTGFDAEPGSLESQLVASASRQWPELADRLKIPFKQTGALLVALDEEQAAQLPALYEKALGNGVDDVELVTAEQARALEPSVAPSVAGGLLVPRESIIDPFTASIAYTEVAIANGADLLLGVSARGIRASDGVNVIDTECGLRIPARIVINACGLGSRKLVDQYGGAPMSLNPRRGQFLVYDKLAARLVTRILLPIPTKHTKGMLVAPTIFGNLLAGPTAEDLPPDDVDATQTTAAGLAAVRTSAHAMVPAIADQPVIASYAGLRCNCAEGSYWLRFNDGLPGVVTLAGIRSTGLTASISLAQLVAERLAAECRLDLRPSPLATSARADSKWPGWWRHPFDDAARVAARPDYGAILCSCENISRGDVQDALDGYAGMASLDGLKRRTRILTGRCQGFNCCVPAAEMIGRHFHVPLASVTKRGPGSEFIAAAPDKQLADRSAPPPTPYSREKSYRAVIIGAGPAGIGVATGLARAGIRDVLIVDRAAQAGGLPAMYSSHAGAIPTFVWLPRGRIVTGGELAARLRRELEQTQTSLWLETQVLAVDAAAKTVTLVGPHAGKQTIAAETIIFATGAREATSGERGWIVGRRPARQFNTMQVLQLVDGHSALPSERPIIVGSDLIAYSAAAKLQHAGAASPVMCDRSLRPLARIVERLYFRRWSRPSWKPVGEAASLGGDARVSQLLHGDEQELCDGLFVCGSLVPNSELIAAAGLDAGSLDRLPRTARPHELSQPGLFIAGGAVGGFHGAAWCYRDGRRAAKCIAGFLRSRG